MERVKKNKEIPEIDPVCCGALRHSIFEVEMWLSRVNRENAHGHLGSA